MAEIIVYIAHSADGFIADRAGSIDWLKPFEAEVLIDALNQMRIRELMRLIDLTVAKTFAVLSERHGLAEDEMYEIFQGFLKPAAMELQE